MKHIGLIPRSRLSKLPEHLRCIHEFCFFLHDQTVSLLREYEEAEAHHVSLKFRNEKEKAEFLYIADTQDPITAMKAIGRHQEAQKCEINTIIIGLTSDYLHHVYESLICFEKRKFIVGFNVLRKPLKDNLLFLSWILGNEDEFHNCFNSGNVNLLTQRNLGNRRVEIFNTALSHTRLPDEFCGESLNKILYSSSYNSGLEKFFQHSVHLITTNTDIITSPNNFNFVFKDPSSEDIYLQLYDILPYLLLYSTHVIYQLFSRIHPIDSGSDEAFRTRTLLSFKLLDDPLSINQLIKELNVSIGKNLTCSNCDSISKITKYNLAKMLLTDSIRCTNCKKVSYFPFSWAF